MVRTSLILLLAHGALASLDITHLERVGALDAADIDSCVTAASVLSTCVAQPSFTKLPEASQAKCLCCDGRSNIASEYKGCASYVKTAVPKETALYTENLIIASACSIYSTVCGAGAGTTASSPTTRSSNAASGTAVISEPPACSSVDSIVLSCSRAVPSFLSLPGSQQASCVCYNTIGGSFTTSFDRYVASCASYLRTADTSAYSRITSLTTFCAKRTAEASPGSQDTFFARPTTESTASEPTETSRSFTGTTTVTAARASSTSTSIGQAGQHAVTSGPVAWVAGLLTSLLSFFILL